jgi:SAM-dependent methyltransferase
VPHDDVLAQARSYYTSRFAAHGATPAGVDWNSSESQELRFAQLLRVTEGRRRFSILDYGCGYGALSQWLAQGDRDYEYVGFDLSQEMIEYARARASTSSAARFSADEAALEAQDFAVASGIFNVKLDVDDARWQEYVVDVIGRLDSLSRLGFAFNILTSHSDSDRMRGDLYYGDPVFYFDHCIRSYARNVALLHDYGLYEFTILVRKDLA